ncbi:MAG: B12-binding domain-containing radical SAM protein [Chloroflexi bacterium HGW-Chloroflexi-8]|nr:MAG: B12-binding domain-containing radical SAM protein [Chloroflexi bacterium HGW-Chloroflexi-8]
MKILLLYPEFPDTFWSFKHALKFIDKKAGTPPLGLLTIAAMLPHGWEKRLVDVNIHPLQDSDLEWADWVMISAMVVQRDSAHELIERAKNAGKIVIAGGPLFSTEYESFPLVDHFVLNEGEITLPQFMMDYHLGSLKRVYTSDEHPDLEKTPAPLWELADLKQYATMSIQFSRGCPFNCDFCNITVMLGHRPRTKSAKQLISELDGLYQLGWREPVFIVDDNFIGNKKILKEEVLPALIEWRKGKVGVPFNTEVSINLSDDGELMEMMVQAGFNEVFVGIETPNEESLVECSKKQNQNRDLVQSVKRIQRAGMEVQGGFIVGFDSDTESIFEKQANFIMKSGITTAMIGLLQAPTGTRLYDRMKKEGRLLGEMTGDNGDGSTNIIPRLDLAVLKRGHQRLISYLYTPKAYYQRAKSFLQTVQPPKVQIYMDWNYIRALFRSIISLGIQGVERVEYWKLFFWALFKKPRIFPQAITLAIYGHHFRTLAEQLFKEKLPDLFALE